MNQSTEESKTEKEELRVEGRTSIDEELKDEEPKIEEVKREETQIEIIEELKDSVDDKLLINETKLSKEDDKPPPETKVKLIDKIFFNNSLGRNLFPRLKVSLLI